jgi:hypothetical protein
MCLYSKEFKPKVAEKDIICFKTLVGRRGDGRFESPYMGKKVNSAILSGKLSYNAKGRIQPIVNIGYNDLGKLYRIGNGLVHTWQDFKTAWQHAVKFSSMFKEVIFECVIPAGTKYYEGYFDAQDGNGEKCYGSKKIKFIKQVYPK